MSNTVFRYIHEWFKYNLYIYTFPMIHIGDKNFYLRINELINDLNYLLLEGINLQNNKILKKSKEFGKYHELARITGLVTQFNELKVPNDIDYEIIDMDSNTFNKEYDDLKYSDKSKYKQFEKIIKTISKKMKQDLKGIIKNWLSYPEEYVVSLINPSKQHAFKHKNNNPLDLLISNKRNDIFRKNLKLFIDKNENRKYRFDVGILVGDRHMPHIYEVLLENDFKWNLFEKITIIE